MTRYAKLIMVAVGKGAAAQSNKFYEMIDNGSTITVKYGRVESTSTTITKPSSQWDSIIREKLKKGYKDVTHLVSVQDEPKKTEKQLSEILNKEVNSFMNLLKRYTDGLVTRTYSVKATSVTPQQVDNAQSIIDKLKRMKKAKDDEVNELLIDLYTTIPRRMANVSLHLLPNIKLATALEQEQDNLDAIASQVKTISKQEQPDQKDGTILDQLGINMELVKERVPELEYLLKQCKGSPTVYRVVKDKEDKKFDKWVKAQTNKQTRILIHGTRCSSVIPILEQGLKIRPSGNFQFSGKVYGDGNYFSETVSKSLGYTGHDNDQILIVYEVHVGNPFVYEGWYNGNSFSLDYENLQKRGFDSTFVKAGNGLLNSEIIAYKEEQCAPRFIIHLKR